MCIFGTMTRFFSGVLFVLGFLNLAIGESKELNLLDLSSCFEDSSSLLTIDHISDTAYDQTFSPVSDQIRNQSFSSSTFWFKIDQKVFRQYSNFSIVSKNIFIDSLTLYTYVNGNWECQSSGLLVPSIGNNYNSLLPTITLNEHSDKENHYLSVKSTCLSALDLWLKSDIQIQEDESIKRTFYISMSVVCLVYILASMFFFILSKKPGLLFLGIYAFSACLMALYMNGFIFQWLQIEALYFYKWSFAWVIDFFFLASLLFSYHIFDIKTNSRLLHKIYLLLFALTGVLILSPLFLNRSLVALAHFFTPSIFFLFHVVIGFYLYFKKKNDAAIYLAIGWLGYLLSSLIWSTTKMGHFEKSFFTENATAFGILFELLMFAVIGGLHYRKGFIEKTVLESRLINIDIQKAKIDNQFGERIRSLSTREHEVLILISKGCLDKEIADQLGIALASVRTYCGRIFSKLAVSNRTEASEVYHKYQSMESL